MEQDRVRSRKEVDFSRLFRRLLIGLGVPLITSLIVIPFTYASLSTGDEIAQLIFMLSVLIVANSTPSLLFAGGAAVAERRVKHKRGEEGAFTKGDSRWTRPTDIAASGMGALGAAVGGIVALLGSAVMRSRALEPASVEIAVLYWFGIFLLGSSCLFVVLFFVGCVLAARARRNRGIQEDDKPTSHPTDGGEDGTR